MFQENRLIYKFELKDLTSTQVEYKASLGETRFALDSRINGQELAQQLPDDIDAHMKTITDDNFESLQLDTRKHLVPFAQALLRTKFNKGISENSEFAGKNGRTVALLEQQLRDFVTKLDKDPNENIQFNASESAFVLWLQRMYLATAFYKKRFDAIQNDTRGQLESTVDSLGDKAAAGFNRLIEVARSKPGWQVGAAIAGVAAILMFANNAFKQMQGGDTPEKNKGLFSILGKMALFGGGAFGLYHGGSFLYEAFQDRKLSDDTERLVNTTDVNSYVKLLNLTESTSEENAAVATSFVDALTFGPYAKIPFTTLQAKYATAAKKSAASEQTLKGAYKENPSEGEKKSAEKYDKDVFKGMKALTTKLENMKNELKNKDLDPYRRESLEELFASIERGETAQSLLIRIVAYEQSSTRDYHTYVGKWIDGFTKTDRDDSLLQPFDNWMNRLDDPAQIADVHKVFAEQDFLLSSQGTKKGKKTLTSEWLKATFANQLLSHEAIMVHPQGSLMLTALRNGENGKAVGALGATYLAVQVDIDDDNEPPATILRRANKKLREQYKISGDTDVRFEAVLGARMANGKYGLLVKAVEGPEPNLV